MPLSFEPASSDDAHYIVAALTEVRMEPAGTLCPRVVVIFASGLVDGFEVMRYAQQTLRIGNVPAMEQVFRDPGQVRVWSRGFALVEGLIEGSVISRLCDTYKLDTRTALAPNLSTNTRTRSSSTCCTSICIRMATPIPPAHSNLLAWPATCRLICETASRTIASFAG